MTQTWLEALQASEENNVTNDIAVIPQALVAAYGDGTYCVIVEGDVVANEVDVNGVDTVLTERCIANHGWK